MNLTKLQYNNLTTALEISRSLSVTVNELTLILNKGILFADNFSSSIQTATFSAANTDVRLDHNLGRVPSGYLVLSRSANSVIYDGSSESTSQFIFLRASAAVVARVMIF